MSEYAVITQNDESKWDDIKGDLYNYPSTYKNILTPGCKVIYYKGRMTNDSYESERLSKDPHYFGSGIIGEAITNDNNDWYCEILDYQEFIDAIPFKNESGYLEDIPESRKNNYWRFGVREINQSTYEKILSKANVAEYKIKLPSENQDLESFEIIEGEKKGRYTTYYERNPF